MVYVLTIHWLLIVVCLSHWRLLPTIVAQYVNLPIDQSLMTPLIVEPLLILFINWFLMPALIVKGFSTNAIITWLVINWLINHWSLHWLLIVDRIGSPPIGLPTGKYPLIGFIRCSQVPSRYVLLLCHAAGSCGYGVSCWNQHLSRGRFKSGNR